MNIYIYICFFLPKNNRCILMPRCQVRTLVLPDAGDEFVIANDTTIPHAGGGAPPYAPTEP